MPSPYTISLPANEWVSLSQEQFRTATDGTLAPQETLVRQKQDQTTLFIEFECKNDPYWKQTTLTEHNSSLWQQEVFEVFIAYGKEKPKRYLEIELNPNNALFVGWIDNPDGEGRANTLTMVPYEEAGIKHSITGTTDDSWRGELRIPLRLIDPLLSKASNANLREATFRLNFYRIILQKPQSDPHWQCSPANASFQCWSPTLSGTSPRFHRPSSFGILSFD